MVREKNGKQALLSPKTPSWDLFFHRFGRPVFSRRFSGGPKATAPRSEVSWNGMERKPQGWLARLCVSAERRPFFVRKVVGKTERKRRKEKTIHSM